MLRVIFLSCLFGILSINFLGQNAHSQEDDENAVESQNSAEDSPLGMEFSRQLQQLQDTSKTINNRNARRKQNEYYPQYTYFVSDFDDPRKLEIHGAKTFSPVEIKSALFKNLSVIHAATPSADLLNFEKTLKNAALAGYRQAGFPDAKITAKANREDKHFRMDIEEGVRYLAGNIIVRNAKTISAEKLIARLQSKHLPANATLKSFQNVNGEQTEVWVDENGNNADLSPPVWVPGKPAAFESWTESPADRYAELFELKPAPSIIEDIKSAFEVQGYFFVKFESRYVLDKSEKTATLAIEILDEGPLSEIGSIEILGNKINTEEEVLNYLGVRPGMPFTREDLLRLNKKLWDAARFIKAKTTPMKPASAGDKLLLRIELVEYPHAPALSKPFSAEEQIMLKFGAFLSNSRNWNGDLTLRADSESNRLDFVQSSEDGSYAHLKSEYPQTDGVRGDLDYELIYSSEETGFYSIPQQRKYVAKKCKYVSVASFDIHFNEDRDSDALLCFGYAFSWRSINENDVPKSAFDLHLQMPPACCVALLYYRDPKIDLKDGVLSLSDPEFSCKIEAETGHLLSLTYDSMTADSSKEQKTHEEINSDKPQAEAKEPIEPSKPSNTDENAERKNAASEDEPYPPCKIELRFVKGTFKEAADKIQRNSDDFENECNSDRCLSSFLAFCCNEPYLANYLKELKYNDKWLQIAQRFLAFGVLDPLDQMINESQNVNNNFVIPCEPGWMNSGWNITNPSYWAMLALSINDDLFPVSSWPWTLIQQTGFISINKMEHVSGEGSRLYNSPDTGPLSFLATATLLDYWNSPATKTIAQRGLDRLDKKAFLADCKPFLSKNHQVGKCLRKAVDAYRFFTNEEVRALAEKLDGKNLKYLALCDQILRSDPARDFDDVMPELLGSLWDAGLKDQIELSLIHLLNNKK